MRRGARVASERTVRPGVTPPPPAPPFALPIALFSAPPICLPDINLPIRLGLGFRGAAAVRDAPSGSGGGGSGGGGGGGGGSEGGVCEAARAVEGTARAAALVEGEEGEEEGGGEEEEEEDDDAGGEAEVAHLRTAGRQAVGVGGLGTGRRGGEGLSRRYIYR